MYPATLPLRWLDGFVGLCCGCGVGWFVFVSSSMSSSILVEILIRIQISTALLIFLPKKKISSDHHPADVTRAQDEPAKTRSK